MGIRAVVFDLWGTLVRWPHDEARELRTRWAERLGVPAGRLEELWNQADAYESRESGPLLPFLDSIRTAAESNVDVEEFLAWRVDFARTALVADRGTVETLAELRRRGYSIGLVSNCTEDVAIVWPETEFAGLFDAAVFSARVGCLKPDRRIYELVCSELGVAPGDCLFVGDGANDELAGAERAGMTPVLIHQAGEEPAWESVRHWAGPRITSVSQVFDLIE